MIHNVIFVDLLNSHLPECRPIKLHLTMIFE